MFKLNLHARIELALAAALLLGSCDGSLSDHQTDQVTDVANSAAEVAIEQSEKIANIESTCDDVEERVTAIEGRLNM